MPVDADASRGDGSIGHRGRLSQALAAQTYGVSAKIVARWVERFKAEGREGMTHRSSRPRTLYRPTEAATVACIAALRRHWLTGKHIASAVGVSPATVSRILQRAGQCRG